MNRINPIHILIFLFVLFLFFMLGLKNVKTELTEAKVAYRETLELALQLKGLNEIYSDKQSVIQSIDRILKQSSLQSSHIEKKITSSSIVLHSQSLGKIALNSLMGKFLNGAYNISELKIQKLSDEKASLTMEIKW